MRSMILLNVFYFVAIFVLTKIMKKREAFNPRKFMIFYNFTCMCLATYCFVGMVWFYYSKGNAFTCQTVDFDTNDSKWLAHVENEIEINPSLFTFTMCRSIGSTLILSSSFYANRSVKLLSFTSITTAV